jgi:hypothetical protein
MPKEMEVACKFEAAAMAAAHEAAAAARAEVGASVTG